MGWSQGPKAVLGPGTGLGEAQLFWDEIQGGYKVWPSEGSHSGFAPRGWKQRALQVSAHSTDSPVPVPGTRSRTDATVWPIKAIHSATPSPHDIPLRPSHLLHGHLCLQATPSDSAREQYTVIVTYRHSPHIQCDCDIGIGL